MCCVYMYIDLQIIVDFNAKSLATLDIHLNIALVSKTVVTTSLLYLNT